MREGMREERCGGDKETVIYGKLTAIQRETVWRYCRRGENLKDGGNRGLNVST